MLVPQYCCQQYAVYFVSRHYDAVAIPTLCIAPPLNGIARPLTETTLVEPYATVPFIGSSNLDGPMSNMKVDCFSSTTVPSCVKSHNCAGHCTYSCKCSSGWPHTKVRKQAPFPSTISAKLHKQGQRFKVYSTVLWCVVVWTDVHLTWQPHCYIFLLHFVLLHLAKATTSCIMQVDALVQPRIRFGAKKGRVWQNGVSNDRILCMLILLHHFIASFYCIRLLLNALCSRCRHDATVECSCYCWMQLLPLNAAATVECSCYCWAQHGVSECSTDCWMHTTLCTCRHVTNWRKLHV